MKWFDMIPSELYGEPSKKPQGSAIGFTGFGQDGKLQPSNPTNMVQTTQGPRLLHEGEATMQGPDGNVQVIPQDKLRSIGRGMPGFQEGGIFTPSTDTTNTSGLGTSTTGSGTSPEPETDVQQGIGVLRNVVSGKSPVTESLYNQATSNLGGAQTAAIGAAKQEAAQAGYTKEGIGSVAQTTMRNMEGERSKLFGNIATATQGNMVSAANSLITAGTGERTYTNTQNLKDWNEALLYNDPDTPQGQAALTAEWKRTHPTSTTVPDFNVMREERNYARTQREQAITLGGINISNSQIDNGVKAFNVEPNKMLALYTAISNGTVYDALSASNFLGKPVSKEQYDSMAADKTYTNALRDVSLLSAKTQQQIYQGTADKAVYDNIKQKIADGATLDEIQKIDPKFSTAVYTALQREATITRGLQDIELTNARTSSDSATWNAFTQKVKESNGQLTVAQLKEQFPGINVTQGLIDGVMKDKTLGLAKDAFTEALLYNDPNTTTGLAAIKQAWVDSHPGKTLADAPDFETLKEEAADAKQQRKDNAVIAAGKLSEALIGDAIDTNGESITSTNILTSKTYQGAINNTNLRQSIATIYGITDLKDPRINGYIQAKIETAIKGDVPLLVQKFIDNGYVDENYKDTPGWEGQLKRSIQDMLNSGKMDKDGNILKGGALPWYDPSTFNNYTDWNGNDIVYDGSGNKPATYATTQVILTGNGTTYYQTVAGVKKAITFADMDNTWQTLSEIEKAAFFADDKGNPISFNQKAFMDKYFLNGKSTSGGVGQLGSVMLTTDKIDNYLFGSSDDTVLNKIVGNIMGDPETGSTGFTSGAKYPGVVGEGSDPNAGVSLSTLNAYQYYDDKGVLHSDGSTANGGDTQLNKIWLQFSQMLNGGEIMTAQKFKGLWNEGKGWYINSDGIVTNFLPQFKTDFGSNGPITPTVYYEKRGLTAPTTIQSNADYSAMAKAAVNDPAKYQELLKNPYIKEWTPQTSYNSGGVFGTDSRYFTNPPAVGTVIKYGGGAYEVLTSVVMRKSGENTQTFTVKDLKDGTTRTIAISGNHNGSLNITGF